MKWLGGAGAATEPFCHLTYLWAEHGGLGDLGGILGRTEPLTTGGWGKQ